MIAQLEYEGKEIRKQVKGGEVWFCAKDVCEVLGISDSRTATADLLDSEAGAVSMRIRSENGVEQKRNVMFINESGLYQIIFKSKKPKAKEFLRWVTGEVLPSIRKTGGYVAPSETHEPELKATVTYGAHSFHNMMATVAKIESEEMRRAFAADFRELMEGSKVGVREVNPEIEK